MWSRAKHFEIQKLREKPGIDDYWQQKAIGGLLFVEGKVHLAGEEVYRFLRSELLRGTGREKRRYEPLTLRCCFDCHRQSRQLSLALIHQRRQCGNVFPGHC